MQLKHLYSIAFIAFYFNLFYIFPKGEMVTFPLGRRMGRGSKKQEPELLIGNYTYKT
jgi:hypothetical protein